MLTQEYIKDFNRLASQINFLSSGANEVALKNKLLLVQNDITNVSSRNFNSFEIINFYSNIYNILSQSRDIQSPLVGGCLELLISSIECKNTELKKIVCEINFLPEVCKLLMQTDSRHENVNEEKTLRVLVLLKSLVTNHGSDHLDEYNTKVLVSSLCDHISNCQNEKIFRLSLHALSNLAMQCPGADYLIRKSIVVRDIQKKISQAAEGLVERKFLTIVLGLTMSPKDFPRLILLSLKSIKAAIATYDAEPILHSIDLLKHTKKGMMQLSDFGLMQEPIVKLLEDLNCLLITQVDAETQHDLQDEFIDKILQYYVLLLESDRELVTSFSTLTSWIFASSCYSRSSSAFAYLSTYISLNGSFTDIDQSIGSLLVYFSDLRDDDEDGDYDRKHAFLNFLSTLCRNGMLAQHESALKLMEKMVSRVKEYKIEDINKHTVKLAVHLLHALYLLSLRSNRFSDPLTDLLGFAMLPCMMAKAYAFQDEDVLVVLFDLSSMPQFPKEAVAKLMASAHRQENVIEQPISLTRRLTDESRFSKYIDGKLQLELTRLVDTINCKVDDGKLESLKASEMISLYRQKNTYMQAHLDSANASLNKFSDLCNEIQQQNLRLSKLGERHELMNWKLQLDQERAQEEICSLTNSNRQLTASLAKFELKIEKEFVKSTQIQKTLTLKTMEVDKLKAEKDLMESEKLKFKIAQKENENRIQQLKKELEHEKQSRLQEVSEAVAEQRQLNEKRLNAEKDNTKLQEIIKLNERELIEKQEKILQLENELKEAEKIQSSIMSLMQKSRNK